MKRDKIIYWVVTGLFSLMLGAGGATYLFMPEMAGEMFKPLGYPLYIIPTMGIAKLLGVVAIVSNKSERLKQWAYFGFFIDLFLAAQSHIAVGDGEVAGALMGLVLLIVSYIFNERVNKAK